MEVSAWQEVAPPEQRHGIEGDVAAGAGLSHLKRSLGQVQVLCLSRDSRLQDRRGLAGGKAGKAGLTGQGDPRQVLVHTRAQGPQQVCSEQRRNGRVVVWDSQETVIPLGDPGGRVHGETGGRMGELSLLSGKWGTEPDKSEGAKAKEKRTGPGARRQAVAGTGMPP